MRKAKILVLAMVLTTLLSACGSAGEKTGEAKSSLYDKGLEVVALLDEMVKNDTGMLNPLWKHIISIAQMC